MTPAFALRKRPDAAFEALYRRHVHDVYRYTLAVLGNAADAEDVTQTTFMNAYRAFQAGERPRKPTNWLRAIAHNVCRQRFRQAERRPRDVVALDELAAPAAPEEPEGPSAADISRALQSLPFNQRSALVMRELEGRRQAEIATALGLSESAVEALLFRARRAMREQLESSITCGEAARAISAQLDRSLSREERGALRAHLRECEECAAFARQARAQRGALKGLGAVPLPATLLTWSGGSGVSGVAAGVGIGAKVAAGVAAVVVAVGVGDVAVQRFSEPGTAREQRDEGVTAAKPGRSRAVDRGVAASAPAARADHARGARSGGSSHATRARGRSAKSPPLPGGATAKGRQVRAHGQPSSLPPPSQGSNGRRVRAHGNPPAHAAPPQHAHGRPPQAHAQPATPPDSPPGRAGKPPKPDKPPKP